MLIPDWMRCISNSLDWCPAATLKVLAISIGLHLFETWGQWPFVCRSVCFWVAQNWFCFELVANGFDRIVEQDFYLCWSVPMSLQISSTCSILCVEKNAYALLVLVCKFLLWASRHWVDRGPVKVRRGWAIWGCVGHSGNKLNFFAVCL